MEAVVLVKGGGSAASGAGVFIAGDGAEAHFRHALQQKRGREALRRKTLTKYADKAGINFGRGNPGILDRGARYAGDQAFQIGFAFKLAKGAMRPADDCSFGHDGVSGLPSLCQGSPAL
jgi:hypothetical protein